MIRSSEVMSVEELEVLRKKARNITIIGILISIVIGIVSFIIFNSPFSFFKIGRAHV